MPKKITSQTEDYSQWYLDVIDQAELAENSPVRGCMIFKPYGYAIWEKFHQILDQMFKETGHENAYFPLFIPKSFLSKEAKHVEGFAKECAIVTHHRLKADPQSGELEPDPDSKLEEELIVRPTSETIINDSFSRWISSYRDLPLKINQWANVVRWEMRTRPFLRTTEFLWQEGHTAHETSQEALDEAKTMLEVYLQFCHQYLAMDPVAGEKSESERFAGAELTYTIEAMMQDGKALQAGTSHFLGQNFAKAFNVTFNNRQGELEHVWQTSWGVSTRLFGGLIMTHSDDKGLVLPPNIAPIQVVIVPIWKNDQQQATISQEVEKLSKELTAAKLDIKTDLRDYVSPGAKFHEWEKKGIPVRVEIGPKDLEQNQAVLVRRDTGEKISVKLENLVAEIKSLLEKMQTDLFERAQQFRKDNTYQVNTWEEFIDVIDNKKGFALAHWDGTTQTEEEIQAKTKATIRCIPLDSKEEKGECILTGKPSSRRVVFAKAY